MTVPAGRGTGLTDSATTKDGVADVTEENPVPAEQSGELRRYPAHPSQPATGPTAPGDTAASTPSATAEATTETTADPATEAPVGDQDATPEPSQGAAPATAGDGDDTDADAEDAGPEAAAPTAGETPADAGTGEQVAGPDRQLEEIHTQLAAVATAVVGIDQLQRQVSELARLRSRDVDLAEKLHAENTRLRHGEITKAMAPLLTGLLRLHDQMVSLAGGDPQSVAGMLRGQLVQLLDTAVGVTAYEPAAGDPFDSSRHSGAGRVPTEDPAQDGTVARCARPGFARGDGSVVRVAEVEVYRHFATPQPPQHGTNPTPAASTETTHVTPAPAAAGADSQEQL